MKKLELTSYHGFSSLKSIDATQERLVILKEILGVKSNTELIQKIRSNPKDLEKSILKLYSKIGPRSLGINPTPYCNRKCTFRSSEQRNEINIADGIEISEAKLKSLLSDFESISGKGVVLVGGGEALLACKGKLNEIVSEYNLHYGMNTNGVNLDKFNNKKFIKKLSWVSISILADTKKLYNMVGRLPADSDQFEILEKNIKDLLRLTKNTNTYVSAKIMICRENYLFAGRIYNYIKNLGFKDIALRCVNNFEPERTYRNRKLKYQDVELNSDQKKRLYNILKKETDIRQEEIENITGIKKNKNTPCISKTGICWNILLGLIANIDTDGNVYLCNPHLGENNFEIGNINKSSFKKIWASKKHVAVVMKTVFNSKNCNLSKCRHARVNETIDLFLHKYIKLSDRTKGDKLMSYFP